VSVTEFIVVVLCIIVWFERPGPWYVSVNWKEAPGVAIVKFGLSSKFNPFHVEVTPSKVTLVLDIDPDPVGVRFPSAFTPDKDFVNDFWEIPNIDEYFPENKVKIYNRWGELLFESEKGKYSINPWDGKHKGKSLAVGSYYYIIQLNEQNQEDKSGSVSIIK